jgi:hypothetical protein
VKFLQVSGCSKQRIEHAKNDISSYVLSVQDVIDAGPYTSRQSEKACEMQFKMGEEGYVGRLSSDKATFHISRKVNRHIVCTWATKQPFAQIDHQRDS